MSPEQQKKLIEIRKKKQELLLEIQVSKNWHENIIKHFSNHFFRLGSYDVEAQLNKTQRNECTQLRPDVLILFGRDRKLYKRVTIRYVNEPPEAM